MRTLVLSLVMVFVFALPASAAVTLPEKADDATIEQLQKKRYHLANTLNRMGNVNNSMSSYTRWAKNGPSSDAKNIRGINDMKSPLERMRKAASEYAGVPINLGALDTAMEEVAKAAKELQEIAAVAYTYYNRKDYLTDDMAKGKEMHPELLKAYEDLSAAVAALTPLENSFSDQMEPLESTWIAEKFGKEYYWHHKNLMPKARAIVKLIPSQHNSNIDAKAYDAAVKGFAEALGEFETYSEKIGEEALRKQALGVLKPGTFDRFLAAARVLGLDLAGEAAKDRTYIKHVNSVISAYNSLVDSANRTQPRAQLLK